MADYLSDDYVASLLVKDASGPQNRHPQSGLGSLLGGRPRSSAPKPNTRFLENIIRDTNNHNAALIAKEAEESRAKLRKLRCEREKQHGGPERAVFNARGKHEALEESKSKRKRVVDGIGYNGLSSKRLNGTNPNRWSGLLSGLGERKECKTRTNHSPDEVLDGKGGLHNPNSDRKPKRRRSLERYDGLSARSTKRSRSNAANDDTRQDSTRHISHRSISSPNGFCNSRRRDRNQSGRSGKSLSPFRARAQTPERYRSPTLQASPSDSDPLDSILGPRPQPAIKLRSKGRGAFTSASAIDSRFAANYNPKADVSLEPSEEDDWDMALEALRDRQKWRAQGAERLKAAGFTDEEVKKWEKGGEKDENDVRWRKKGEDREWDRGKTINDDGGVDVGPDWGRLRGT